MWWKWDQLIGGGNGRVAAICLVILMQQLETTFIQCKWVGTCKRKWQQCHSSIFDGRRENYARLKQHGVGDYQR